MHEENAEEFACGQPNNNCDDAERSNSKISDESVQLRNTNLKTMKSDFLYHLALGTATHDLPHMFGDVKFVCMGGTANRMENFAYYFIKEAGFQLPTGTALQDLCVKSCRFSMYKVGPVLFVNHGMGVGSISILLHEVCKLMYHAKCRDPIFFRAGTCGGIGVEGGTVIVTEKAYDAQLRNSHEFVILGKPVQRPAILDQSIVAGIRALSCSDDDFKIIQANTLCTCDFYEGQGRMDGAICEYSEQDKMRYMQLLHDNGIRNIEMECSFFAALTHYAGIRAAIVNVALINRLETDQVSTPKELMQQWEIYPQIVITRYIKKALDAAAKLTN